MAIVQGPSPEVRADSGPDPDLFREYLCEVCGEFHSDADDPYLWDDGGRWVPGPEPDFVEHLGSAMLGHHDD